MPGNRGNLTVFCAIISVMAIRHSTDDSTVDDAIRSVRGGNANAFEIVVRQFERPLRAWLAVQTPPGIDVDEVAQRSFIAAFTRLDDYKLGAFSFLLTDC